MEFGRERIVVLAKRSLDSPVKDDGVTDHLVSLSTTTIPPTIPLAGYRGGGGRPRA